MTSGNSDRDAEFRQLVTRCLTGNQGAMLQLVQQCWGQVFGLALRMLGNRQDAEDICQETFSRVLRSLHKWDPTRDFHPWLLAIAGNRCRTMLSNRKRQRRPESLVEDVAESRSESADELQEELTGAIATLRAEYREAFCLFHEQELSYEQIAEVMQVPLGTIKTWVHRARKEIVTHLRQRGVFSEDRHAVP